LTLISPLADGVLHLAGTLEVRVPMPKIPPEPEFKKVPVEHT
jgi:hypothetical protein